ncbi:MAG: peptidase M24 [Chloroflexi bacterium RBG_13_68_17]|nr:MAG: peptidase M24 [Chloroflexi bacterium RBG_13_68_17]
MSQERLSRLRQALRQHGLDALALIPGPSLFYLTGLSFHLMERPVIGLFTPDDEPRLVLPELESGKVARALIPLTPFAYGEDESSRSQAIAQAAGDLSGRTIAIEPLRMRAFEMQLLEQAAPGAIIVPGGPAVSGLRLIKESGEVAAIRKAITVAETALEATLSLVRIGMTERDLAGELTIQMLRAGSDSELPFAPIVATGPNSAMPHAVPGERRLQPGDLLILDWGAAVEGYISDLTRTFAVGETDPELARIHEIVQQANAAGRWAVRPGATCAEVDQAARAVIRAAGYADFFTHRTGHGIGLEAHEGPYVRGDNAEALVAGMTFTVEPGIYLPGRGGARVEDNVLVTPEGCECLTSAPRELRVIA